MMIFGLTIAEIATLLGIISILAAWLHQSVRAIRTQITAPLIEALDKLRSEISQLDQRLTAEYQRLTEEVADIKQMKKVGREG